MRQLEQIGQDRFSGGISYTFAVFPSGRVHAGHSIGRVGAHTAGHNTTSAGIVLVGDYSRVGMTAPQLVALVALLAHGVASGWWLELKLSGGHRDTKSTACPGSAAYAQIGAVNTAAGKVSDPAPGGGSVPSVPGGTLPDPLNPITYGRDTMFIIRRGNSGTIVRVDSPGLWTAINEQTRDDLVTHCGYHNGGNLATATFDRILTGYEPGPVGSAVWGAGVGSGENRRALSTVLVSADSAARQGLAVAEAVLTAVQQAPGVELPDDLVEDLAARLEQARADLDGAYTVTIERTAP